MTEMATLEAREAAIREEIQAAAIQVVATREEIQAAAIQAAVLLPGTTEAIQINPIVTNAPLLSFWANLHTAGEIILIA